MQQGQDVQQGKEETLQQEDSHQQEQEKQTEAPFVNIISVEGNDMFINKKDSLPSDVEEAQPYPEYEEQEALAKLKFMTDVIKQRMKSIPKGEYENVYTRTEMKTFESFEEVKSNVSNGLNDVKISIKRKKVTIVQKTIITVVETVSKWLDNVEYKILKVKKISSIQKKKQELKNIKNEIEVIEETVDELVEVTEMAVEIFNDEAKVTISSCVNSLKDQVRVVKLFHQKSEEELEETETHWDEFMEGVKMVESLVKDLQKTIEDLKVKDEASEESVNTLSELETSTRGHRNKLSYLIMTAKGLVNDLPENEIPENLFTLFSDSKDIESGIQTDKEKIIGLILSKQEYEETLNEFEDIFNIAESFFVDNFSVLDFQHLNDELMRRKKFFLNLSHCLQILDSNKEKLGKELKEFYSDKHQSINSRGKSILRKGSEHIHYLDMIVNKWSIIEKRKEEIDKVLDRISYDFNLSTSITSEEVARRLSILTENNLTLKVLKCDLDNLKKEIMNIRQVVDSPTLGNILDSTNNQILMLSSVYQQRIYYLVEFLKCWTRYETILVTIQTWLAVVENQEISSKNQMMLLQAELETYEGLDIEANTIFFKALDILNLKDEELQRRLQSQFEERMKRFKEKLRNIDTNESDESDIAAIKQFYVAANASLENSSSCESEEEVISSVNKMNFMLKTLDENLNKLSKLSEAECDYENLEVFGQITNDMEELRQKITKEMNRANILLGHLVELREALVHLETDVDAELRLAETSMTGIDQDYGVLQRNMILLQVNEKKEKVLSKQ